jgi:predicted O-methyltransferase YrrM
MDFHVFYFSLIQYNKLMRSFNEIKLEAQINKIPSMDIEGRLFCIDYIKSNHIQSILEIGTGVGIWSIEMVLANPSIHITSLEKNEHRHRQALTNISDLKLESKIECLLVDGCVYQPTQHYDLIFIDGPKSQNKSLLQKYLKTLNPKGSIIIDNLDFHGLTHAQVDLEHRRNLRQMVYKINTFKEWVKSQTNLNVLELSIGDGIIIVSPKYDEL